MQNKRHPVLNGLSPELPIEQFSEIPLSFTKDWLHCHLVEVADHAMHRICADLLVANREKMKCLVTTHDDAQQAKAFAAALYIQGSQKVNQSVLQLYELEQKGYRIDG